MVALVDENTAADPMTLVNGVSDLIRAMAKAYIARLPRTSYDVDDLYQEGVIAALAKAREFDPDRGNKFWTFAARRVFGAMIDFSRRQDGHRPRQIRDRRAGAVAGLHVQMSSAHLNSLQSKEPDPADAEATATEGLMALGKRLIPHFDNHRREFVRMRYVEGLTLKEIGEKWGLTESRLSQFQWLMLSEAREICEARGIDLASVLSDLTN